MITIELRMSKALIIQKMRRDPEQTAVSGLVGCRDFESSSVPVKPRTALVYSMATAEYLQEMFFKASSELKFSVTRAAPAGQWTAYRQTIRYV